MPAAIAVSTASHVCGENSQSSGTQPVVNLFPMESHGLLEVAQVASPTRGICSFQLSQCGDITQ